MLSSRTPQRDEFEDADAGKTANYLLRWVNSKGKHGPWSQIVSAFVPDAFVDEMFDDALAIYC